MVIFGLFTGLSVGAERTNTADLGEVVVEAVDRAGNVRVDDNGGWLW